MQVGIVVGLGLAIGITLSSGCASDAAEANASFVPVASAPTPLVPEAYTALSAPVVPVASAPSAPVVPVVSAPPAPVAPTVSPPIRTQLLPVPATALAAESRAVPAPSIKFNQYHPYWVVAGH